MRKSYLHVIACLSIFCVFIVKTAAQDVPPKREFRGVWVATVANIDFPSAQGLSPERFADEWVEALDFLQDAGFNAVLAQVRPAGDAFYRSKISPWSKYLTGKQGLAPAGDFDPLAFMVAEAHKRNMEFHAWLNPYRASMDTLTANLAGSHPYKHHPEWFMRYGGKLYFNPAVPEVRDYITEIVLEIVMDYEVDGVHFDDYFYPYPAAGEKFADDADFQKYGFGYSTIEDWRRGNTDKLISQVARMSKVVSPGLKFGVSPFGVWRNASKDPILGSATRAGVNTYDDLYADVRGWLEKGWIDYVAPQLYWNIGFQVADYDVLAKWWKENSFGRHVYIGMAAYKVNNNAEEAWKKPTELPNQLKLNRSLAGIDGSIFYNFNSLKKNPLGLVDSLRTHYFAAPALMPEMPYLKIPQPDPPVLSKPVMKKGVISMNCSVKQTAPVAKYLVVYRFEDRLPGDYNHPKNIFKLIPLQGATSLKIEDKSFEKGKTYTYAVSVASQQHTESMLSNWKAVKVGNKRLKKVK